MLRGAGGTYAAPVHGTVMPDGRVLLIGEERPSLTSKAGEQAWAAIIAPAAAADPLPSEMTVPSLKMPLDVHNTPFGPYLVTDDLLCSGHTLTANGAFFSAGGTRTISNPTTQYLQVTAPSYATSYDGTNWTRVPADMIAASHGEPRRWYPTVTRLPDSRLLVTSGADQVLPSPSYNLTSEAYDPTTGAWTVFSMADPLEIMNVDYTHVFALPAPAHGLLLFGEAGVPVLSSGTANGVWAVRTVPRPGSEQWNADRLAGSWNRDTAPNFGASSAMLPLRVANGAWGYYNGSVLMAGGELAGAVSSKVDVYDPFKDAWRPTLDTQIHRHHPSTVLLPDGKVLVIGGHSTDPGVRQAEYVDPRNGFSVAIGTTDSGEVRGYHTVDLLLPDGRVLVAGGRDIVTATSIEKPSLRYYSPPYMTATRPELFSVPAGIGFGQNFFVDSIGATPAEIVLIGLGSMTHSFDSNQRYVQLITGQPISAGNGYWRTVTTGPSDSLAAPPGYYMLFVVDAQGIPSKAKIIHVG